MFFVCSQHDKLHCLPTDMIWSIWQSQERAAQLMNLNVQENDDAFIDTTKAA
jgi:hypothetical protein